MGCTSTNVQNEDEKRKQKEIIAKEPRITKEMEVNKEKKIEGKEKNENESILNKLSLTMFNQIFSYIKGYNFKYKLFKYSKAFQKKLNLTFFNYQKRYFSKFDKNIDNFIKERNEYILQHGIFYPEDLSEHKIDQNLFESYYINYINNYAHKLDEGKIIQNLKSLQFDYLNLKCPFLASLSKTDIFNRFEILLQMYDIKERYLEQIYIDNFDKLYKTNANYSKLRIVINEEELKYIEELKINDNKVKTISLSNLEEGESEGCVPKYITFLKRFKSLKCLTLYNMKFTPAIELNFPGLEELHLNDCENITLNQELCLNIKKLQIANSFFQKTKKLLQFPKLEELNVYKLENIENIKLVFDFSSLENLKTLASQYELFLLLYNLPLEKLIIIDTKKEQQKELLQKIIDKKTLLSISLGLILDAEEILSLKGQNCTVQEANIGCSYAIKVNAFQKNFLMYFLYMHLLIWAELKIGIKRSLN